MSKPKVFEHSYHHFEDVQLSAQDFYASFRRILSEHKFPDVKHGIVTLADGGLFSSRRDYLEITHQSYRYYVCAAPFGVNFFVSWWLKEEDDIWERLLNWLSGGNRGKSFYEVDTQEIFASSVTAIIRSLIKKIESERGFRLTDAPNT